MENECSVCGGDKETLGKLGNIQYYKCRNCGIQSMKKIDTIKINPNKIKVRDENIKNMITTTGGTSRVFKDKKKENKSDKVGRKAKYKNKGEY